MAVAHVEKSRSRAEYQAQTSASNMLEQAPREDTGSRVLPGTMCPYAARNNTGSRILPDTMCSHAEKSGAPAPPEACRNRTDTRPIGPKSDAADRNLHYIRTSQNDLSGVICMKHHTTTPNREETEPPSLTSGLYDTQNNHTQRRGNRPTRGISE